ncbi:RNA polymerase II C-terminal domain phosphatase-like 1 [Phalaenopsis equestris]|uniref:RNA polymerase II C-terminal domain phosphatase-like 1 n=1 Tax=Phalaenopsis equestris TaxID=78828 RepID=UPI0009E3954A|nr:RNA polymerase II C-terminal domain phosphatase-like 1 [Phalaenopsis equestris]
MARQGIMSVTVFHGDVCLGEAEVLPSTKSPSFQFPKNEIRITQISPPSERCPPLSVLQTISPFSVRCKIQAKSAANDSPISRFYLSCLQEFKTAFMVIGDEELHLVAMLSKGEKFPCFWCCSVRAGLYNSCLGMLNLRCLAIVFDLDETLIVANTMKSFEDRIEALSRRIHSENDPLKVSGMSAELKRYIEDKEMLKQYAESDTVLDNGKLIGVQNEQVPLLHGGLEPIKRPVIRLPERNIVLTRVNPEIRDTSVFVKLRPAWEDLRSYLTAKGRKRFEVFVCTMAERDYALEIWRLLDPESNLISSNQLLDRIVCVKSGSRKSLCHVFRDANCHPKMAMVIDDRLQVWEDRDQPRVHVVPAFTPYYAPQAEMANTVPVLCVARNVACNVRGGFFKEFDEILLRRVFELCYENEIPDLPCAPDVGDYLMSEAYLVAEPVQRQTQATQGIPSDDDGSLNRAPANSESLPLLPSFLLISVLHEIGRRCDSKVEFRSVTGSSKDLHFTIEVLFSSEKIGIGMGRTRKEAQLQAAENALRNLASGYLSFISPNVEVAKPNNISIESENGFLEEYIDTTLDKSSKNELLPSSSLIGQLEQSDKSERLSSVLSGIKDLCLERKNLIFQEVPLASTSCREYCFQVELAGKVLGRGVGISKDRAKLLAAEEALKYLKARSEVQRHKQQNPCGS